MAHLHHKQHLSLDGQMHDKHNLGGVHLMPLQLPGKNNSLNVARNIATIEEEASRDFQEAPSMLHSFRQPVQSSSALTLQIRQLTKTRSTPKRQYSTYMVTSLQIQNKPLNKKPGRPCHLLLVLDVAPTSHLK